MAGSRSVQKVVDRGDAAPQQEIRRDLTERAQLTEPGFALSLQASMLVHARCAPAATAFATKLAEAYACSRVTLGFVKSTDVRLYAVSHGANEDLVGTVFESIAAAMDEAFEQAASIVVPAPHNAVSVIRLAHTRLLQRVGGVIASIPVVYHGDVVAVFSFEWPSPPAALDDIVAQLEALLSLTGPVLYLMYLRDMPLRRRVFFEAGRFFKLLRVRENRNLRLALAGSTLAVVALLFVPVSYRVGGQAHIEGIVQRSLVAPADGFLKSSAVRPGDRVKQGQLLFELDDKDLVLQHQKWASELAQQENAYATATAELDRSQIVISQARADEARAQLALVDSDLERVRVVAPFDGVVIEGDLSRSLGAPVERGSKMMVLAPSGQYRAVIQVDERDVDRLQVGQRGSLSLSALPWDSLPITISRVTPVAHSVDGDNVFDVEADITTGSDHIRPGLAGVAKVVVGHRPLIWIWGHRLIGWLHQLIWNWLP